MAISQVEISTQPLTRHALERLGATPCVSHLRIIRLLEIPNERLYAL